MEEVAAQEGIELTTPFAFSCIMTKDKTNPRLYELKMNLLEGEEHNPYTPQQMVMKLYKQVLENPNDDCWYVNAPLEVYLKKYRLMLFKMFNKAVIQYENIIERDDIMSILFLTVVELYSKDYYLHQSLIYNAFVRNLNKECRKFKGDDKCDSLNVTLQSETGEIEKIDFLPDPRESALAYALGYYTADDYWANQLARVKDAMLQDMSEDKFNRILFELANDCVSSNTSHCLRKYKAEFGGEKPLKPTFIPAVGGN